MIPKIPENSSVDTGSSTPATTRREGRREEAEQQQAEQRERIQSTVGSRPPISSPASTSSTTSASSSSPSEPVSLEKKGWFGGMIGAIKDTVGAYVAGGILGSNADNFINEKNRLIAEAKEAMLSNLHDPQFIALIDMLNLIIWPEVENKLKTDVSKTGLVLQNNKEVIKAILEINLARGFANLSQTVADNQFSIPNYHQHPSLVNVFLTLCQRGSRHIKREQLISIEERYRAPNATFQQLRKELLPTFIAKQNGLIQQYLSQYVSVANSPALSEHTIQKKQKAKVDIIRNLFSELSPTIPDNIKQDFLKKLEKSYNNPEDLQQLSKNLAKEIVNHLMHESMHTPDYSKKSKIVDALFSDEIEGGLKETFNDALLALRGHQNELRELFSDLAEELLTELFPEKVNSLYLSTNLTYIPGVKGIIYNKIKTPLTDLLMSLYEPLENNLARNSAWENELRNKVGGQDLHLLMETPAALLLGFTKNFIQTNPDAVGSIAEFLGSQLVPPPPKESESSQPSAATSSSSQPSTSSLSIDDETKSLEKADRKQQLLLAQLTQGQLAQWIVDSIRILVHSEDSRLLGFGGFIKQVFDNLTLALMAKGTELAFSEEAPTLSLSSSSSTASSSGPQINEHLFFKELADRITPKLQSVLGNSKISEEFWKDLMRDLPLPQLVKDLLLPLLLKKAEELQESLQFNSTSLTDAAREVPNENQRDSESILRQYNGGDELISILDKIANEIVDKAVESNLGLIAELGLEDKIEELMDTYLPGVEITENLKRWFSSNVSALGISAEGTSSQAIAMIKRGITTVLQEAVINTIEKNFGRSSENYAAQLLSNIHTAFNKAFANYDASTREQITAGQEIQTEIRRLESQIAELEKQNVQIKKQGSEHSVHLTKDQHVALESLKKAKLSYHRGQIAITDLQRKRDRTLAKLNSDFPDAPWTHDQLQFILQASLLQQITPAILRNPEEKTHLLSQINRRISFYESNIQEDEEARIYELPLRSDKLLLKILQMPADQLQLLSDGLNLISTARNAEEEMFILSRQLHACEENCERINNREMENRKEWQSFNQLQNQLLNNRQAIGQCKQQIDRLNEELDELLPVFKVLSKELTALLGLEEKEKLQLPHLLRDEIWPIIESAKEGSIARLLFMHITPLILPIFDIPQNRERLQQLTQGDAFLNRLSHTVAERVIARIPDFITSYKPFAKELLVLMGIEQPSIEEIQRMERALQDALIESGRNGVTTSMLEPIVEGYLTKTEEEKARGEKPAALSRISQELQQLTVTPGFQFTQDAVKEILNRAKAPGDAAPLSRREQQKLNNKARALAKTLNQFLLSRGKVDLTSQTLINIYAAQLSDGQPPVAEEEKEDKIRAMQKNLFVRRIKDVAITPEEIAENLNDAIPGARDLHSLVAPELQAVIVGEDPAFQANRKIIQQYAEGMLLRIFIKIAEANKIEGQDILTILTSKLRDLISSRADLAKTPEEVAREMVDTLIKDIIGVKGQEDFKGIPIPLQKLAYDKLKEILYQHLTPYLLPIVTTAQTKEELSKVSGSPFLSEFSKAISKDALNMLFEEFTPNDIAKAVKKGLPNMDDGLHKEIEDLMQMHMTGKSAAFVNLSESAEGWIDGIISKVLLRIAKKNPAKDGKDSLIIATEKLLDIATKKYQAARTRPIAEVAAELEKEIMKDVFGIESYEGFEGVPEELQHIIYDLIKGQLAGKLIRLDASRQKLKSDDPEVQKARAGLKDFDPKEYTGEACGHLLGQLVSKFVIDSLPDTINEMGAEGNLKLVNAISKGIEKNVEELAQGNLNAAQVLLNYTQTAQFQTMLQENLQKIADPTALQEDKKRGAEFIGNLMDLVLNKRLHDWSAQATERKFNIERKLIQSLLEVGVGHIKTLNDAKEIAKAKGRTEILHADFVQAAGSNLHPAVQTAPVDFHKTIDLIFSTLNLSNLSKDQQEQMRKGLVESLTRLADQEKQNIKAISTESAQNTIATVYKQTTGKSLSDEQLKALSQAHAKKLNLKNLIRREAEKPYRKAEKEAYGPCANLILEAFFPKGAENELFLSLTSDLDQKERAKLWKLVQTSLPPAIPNIIESLFNPDTIDQIILNTLESTRDTMRGEIVLGEEEPADRPLDAIDEVSGALIAELMRTLKLPEWVKKKVAPEGVTTAAMKKSMGAAMRRQFNGKFINEMIPKALLSATKKDPKTGKTSLDYVPKAVKQAEMPKKRVQMQADLKRLSREVVDSTISNYIRTQHAVFQKRFDGVIQKLFGKMIGLNIKHLLDAIFRIIFFKIVGTILSILLWPMTKLIKMAIYRFASLDANRDLILDLLKKAPADQPAASYVLYNEDLAFKMVEAIQTAFENDDENKK